MGHGAWGMGHGAWGMGHGAWGMGHGAWGMGHGAYLTTLENRYMVRQELTIAYQHRQPGNSGHRTVRFPYPNIIDRAIGCHDNTAIEDRTRCGFPTPKLSIARVRISRTHRGCRNRVFLGKNLVVTRRFGKKPGFFGRCASWTGVISTRLDVTIAQFFGKRYAVVS